VPRPASTQASLADARLELESDEPRRPPFCRLFAEGLAKSVFQHTEEGVTYEEAQASSHLRAGCLHLRLALRRKPRSAGEVCSPGFSE
jgi:hypothetical protein